MKEELISLSGVIEEIVYHNDENDYTVLELIDRTGHIRTAVGYMTLAAEGEDVTLYGKWTVHADYGEQFSFESYSCELPSEKAAILRYLSSRVVKGVGPATAARIVGKYGEDTFSVIEHHPEWLTSISGISAKKAADIHRSFTEQTGIRSLMMLCRDFFSTAVISRIYKKWGSSAEEKIKENPYMLCGNIFGVSFEKADRFAEREGITGADPRRIEGGIRYILEYNAQANGHTALPEDKLIAAACSHLGIEENEAKASYALMLSRGRLLSVIDEDGCRLVSTETYGGAEHLIAEKLKLLDKTCALFSDRDCSLFIERLEDEFGIRYATAQKRAIAGALKNGVMVLTGGPGTGKTTVVRALLRIFSVAGLSTAVLAPTGRAAKRMSEAAMCEAKTIHRALEMEKSDDLYPIFRRNASDPLSAKVVIVDEASMIDTVLMAALLDAIPRGARLIIIGDVNQLPSVGAGCVLSDLIASERFPTVKLDEIFRQSEESLIVTNAHRINRGEMPVLTARDKDFFYLSYPEGAVGDTVRDLITRRLPKSYGRDIIDQIQVITPSRKGRAGTEALNKLLREAQNPEGKGKKEITVRGIVFREGDRVMQIRNNYDIVWEKDGKEGNGVFNGDMGILESIDGDTARVRFEDRVASYEKENLEELDHAYAITIHKSQGSEYPVVIIPLYSCAPMLETRNLFYTAVTRACRMVILVGNSDVARRMVENDRHDMRYTTLLLRLKK